MEAIEGLRDPRTSSQECHQIERKTKEHIVVTFASVSPFVTLGKVVLGRERQL